MNHAVTYIRGVNNKDLESALRLAASDLGWTVTVGKYKGMVMYDLSGSRILPQMRVGVGNNLLHTFAGLPFWIARKKKSSRISTKIF